MASTAIGIFLTTGADPVAQAALALGTYGLAAERAAIGSDGSGTFRARLLDAVASLHEVGVDGVNIWPAD
ncbi:MAG: hydroxyethylthiazole kinase [Chloroflexota bacterium]|nr:hydroxyethylthiazole kinase [Chloroflexota bacterium]